jgi:hypothetical protein
MILRIAPRGRDGRLVIHGNELLVTAKDLVIFLGRYVRPSQPGNR